MTIQHATIMMWSAITGTRPGVLLPQIESSNLSEPKLSQELPPSSSQKRKQAFRSDLPQHIFLDNLSPAVCYRDIELFHLRDPEEGRDVLCAIIEFRNLKGRPEGSNG
jgi:hypothetical protein